ncbi:hypothetical protein ACFQ0B_50360 [Nonomuraea thailandensis]
MTGPGRAPRADGDAVTGPGPQGAVTGPGPGPQADGGGAEAGTGVRSLWWAARTGGEAPFDTAHLKVHYPAAPDGDRLTGVFAPRGGPYPVVLFLSGINVGQDAYRWLAVEIARAGFVCVTFDRVGELFGGERGLTPGVDLDAAAPAAYGSRPTCPAIGAVLASLAGIELLKGAIDLERVALGGHSAGGSVVLQSARHFPRCGRCSPTARTPWWRPCSAGPRAPYCPPRWTAPSCSRPAPATA